MGFLLLIYNEVVDSWRKKKQIKKTSSEGRFSKGLG